MNDEPRPVLLARLIAQIEHHLYELQAMDHDGFVYAWPDHQTCVAIEPDQPARRAVKGVSVLYATVFPSREAAPRLTLHNGAGERAVLVSRAQVFERSVANLQQSIALLRQTAEREAV